MAHDRNIRELTKLENEIELANTALREFSPAEHDLKFNNLLAKLPDPKQLALSFKKNQAYLKSYNDLHSRYQGRLRLLRNLEGRTEQVIAESNFKTKDPEKDRQLVRHLLAERKDILDLIAQNTFDLSQQFEELVTKEKQLLEQLEELHRSLYNRSLWQRGPAFFDKAFLKGVWSSFKWVFSFKRLQDYAYDLTDDFVQRPLTYLRSILFFVAIFLLRRLSERYASTTRSVQIKHIFANFFYIFSQAALWPCLIWALFLQAEWSFSNPASYVATQRGIYSLAVSIFLCSAFYQVVNRLAKFQYYSLIDKLRASFSFSLFKHFSLIFVVLIYSCSIMRSQQDPSSDYLFGRLCFILSCLSFLGFFTFLYKELGDFLKTEFKALYASLFFFVPLSLICLALLGFYELSTSIALRYSESFFAFLLLLTVAALVELYFDIREERAKRIASSLEAKGEEDLRLISNLRLERILDESKRLFYISFVLLAFFGFFKIWSDLLPAFNSFGSTKLWSVSHQESTVKNESVEVIDIQVDITLNDLFLSLAVFVVTILIVKNIRGLLESLLFRCFSIGRGEQYAIEMIGSYLILFIGSILALNQVGLDWSRLHYLVAAISLGLSFGLRDIFANFFSGLLLLFERPVRVGDTIEVGSVLGVVSRIHMRATTITDFNRGEHIIPNQQMITSQVNNLTLSDASTRLIFQVNVAYGTDLAKVEALLLEIASSTESLCPKLGAYTYFKAFGESSVDLELRCFVTERELIISATNEVYSKIYTRFLEEGIEIPFPQRVLHIEGRLPCS